jgi:hypothetical protein
MVKTNLGWMWCHTLVITALRKLKQKDRKFKASLPILCETLFQGNNNNKNDTTNSVKGSTEVEKIFANHVFDK